MTNKADLLKLADLSSKGKISLNQAEGYLTEKGLKGKDRDYALRYIDAVKKEHLKQTPNANKSGIGILVLIILGIVAVLYYLSSSGKINVASIINLK